VILLCCILSPLFSQVQTKLTPLSVGEHWSRRIVTENGHKRFYYRPDRFEFMEINANGASELQLNAVLTQQADSHEIDVVVRIDKAEQRHTMKIVRKDDKYLYTEPLRLQLDSQTSSVWVKTRNPWVYFRGYSVTTIRRKQRIVLQKPTTYWNSHLLLSPNAQSEYFSGNSENILSYTATANGDIYFFIRAIRDGRKAVTIDILKNGELLQTTVLPNKTSKDYKIAERRVTTGMKIELPAIKAGDTITILPKTEHEVIVRMFQTQRR